MNICFVGMNVDERVVSNYDAVSIAGNKFQNGLVNALRQNNTVEKFVVLPYRTFPHHRLLICNDRKYKKLEDYEVHVVKYINFPILNYMSIKCSIHHAVQKWCDKNKDSDSVIILFNCASYKVKPLIQLSRKYNIPFFVIIADVVPKTNNFFREIERKKQEQLMKKVSGIIPITDLIKKDFAPNQYSLRIEGGVVDIPHNEKLDDSTILITYTGALDENSSIDVLLDAFSSIRCKNLRLQIVGDGKYAKKVEEAAKKDSRIVFLGQVDNIRSIEIQNRSHILVCPRLPDGYVTKYTFPSKLFEYLSTGHCVVAFHLEGIPEEYNEFIYYPKDNNADSLGRLLLELVENKVFFRKEQVVFMMKKQWTFQGKRLEKFISMPMK